LALSLERRAARRGHVVLAAEALIRERGDAGFSMAELATRAGVSPATPYNLLGSKAEILRLVVHGDFERFTDRLAGAGPAGPLARLLHAADLVVSHYEADRAFYRGLFRAAFSTDVAEVRDMMSLEARALWRGWVEAALAAGDLCDWVQPGPLTVVLIRTIGSTAQTWLSEGWPRERFELEMSHSVRLILASVAAPAHREMLAAEIACAQEGIAELTGESLMERAAPGGAERDSRQA
jgi:AcrR family transcriptional regulator